MLAASMDVLYASHRIHQSLILIISLLPLAFSICNFPDFLQSDANNRDWRGQIKSQYTEFTLTISVYREKMSIVSTGSSATTYERICIQDLSDNKFVTMHEQSRQRTQKYVCVQFLQRSHSVVQLKVSEIANSMNGICDDANLSLDPWIWIDKNNVLESPQTCPLVGGYSVKLYDKEYSMALCDAYKDHVWMESECVAGTGLYFNFRYTRCIPNVLMSRQQWTRCLSNWTEDGYTFLLLRHTSLPYLWIMRYPSDIRQLNSFVSYLMKDLYATTGSHISGSQNYVQMDMVRDIAHPVTSLCIDEFEGCNYYSDPCVKGGDMALTCARTCGICNETRPIVCNFDDVWEGDWIDAAHGDRVATTFEPHTLTVYYNRLKQKFHCIRWDEPYSGSKIKHTTFKMLVTEFTDGCRPQYSCVKIVHRDSSPVMFLQLSSERHWPFTSRTSDPINCDNFEFEGDSDNLIPNRYRSKHYRMLYSKSLDTGMSCNMPLGDVSNYTVTLVDNTICSGRVRPSSSGSSVTVSIRDCSDSNSDILKKIPTEHTCVESSRLFTSDLLVISRTDEEPYEFFCWVFPRGLGDLFYLVESTHCNGNTKRRITRGHLQAMAAFSSTPPTQSSISDMVVHSTPKPMSEDSRDSRENSPSGEHSVLDITTSVVNEKPKDTNNNSIPTKDNNSSSTTRPTNPASYASPVVIVAAIIFFIVFQIPCMCKNS